MFWKKKTKKPVEMVEHQEIVDVVDLLVHIEFSDGADFVEHTEMGTASFNGAHQIVIRGEVIRSGVITYRAFAKDFFRLPGVICLPWKAYPLHRVKCVTFTETHRKEQVRYKVKKS